MPDPAASSRRVAEGRDLSRSGGRHLVSSLVSLVVSWIVGAAALMVIDWLLGGLQVDGFGAALVAVLAIAVVGVVLRPLLRQFALLLGWVGVFFLALFVEAVVVALGFALSPGVTTTGFLTAFVAAWLLALVMTVVHWAQGVNQDEEFVGRIVRYARRRHRGVTASDQPGVLFVQLDGVSEPLLRWALRMGNLPTVGRWVREGSHAVDGWRVRVPTTTPVSQAGILHGFNDDIPAFRWWEKERGSLVVANRPPDAALIEERVSDGRGLLADDGASISNIFTGDAPTALLTMAGVGRSGASGVGRAKDFVGFFGTPYGFGRLLFLAVGEMLKERYQARREVALDIRPRVARTGSYVLLRAATNVLQRQLNTALVIEQMMHGRKSIYVDYLDYDEVAHHAGVARPESLAAMAGLDRVLGQLEQAAALAPRPYRIVLVSDHGQSQGTVFAERFEPLEELVRRLVDEALSVQLVADDESYGPVNTLLTGVSQGSGTGSVLARGALGGRTTDGQVALGPQARRDDRGPGAGASPELVVVGSGNLGAVWLAHRAGRLSRETLDEDYPALLPGLAGHPGVSFVVVMTRTRGAVALGPSGCHYLDEGAVEGDDPLARFGPLAVADFRRVAHFPNAPDLYVHSLWEEDSDDVAAFEGLVGCHGGLGGWQDRGLVVHPVDLPLDGPLVGAPAVYEVFVRWLEHLGQRRDLPEPTARPRLPSPTLV